MQLLNEKEMADALSRYIQDEHIDPKNIDHIKILGGSPTQCRMTLILKTLTPIDYIQYTFDISPKI